MDVQESGTVPSDGSSRGDTGYVVGQRASDATIEAVRRAMISGHDVTAYAGTGAAATGRIVHITDNGFVLRTSAERVWFGWHNLAEVK